MKFNVSMWELKEGTTVQFTYVDNTWHMSRSAASSLVKELCEVLYPWDTDKHVASSLRHHLRRARLAALELKKRGYDVEMPEFIDNWDQRDLIVIEKVSNI